MEERGPGYDSIVVTSLFSPDTETTTRNTTHDDVTVKCSEAIPSSGELFKDISYPVAIAIALCGLFLFANIAIYVEEILFFVRHFSGKIRKQKTIYVLGLAPMFSLCGMLGVLVPRAGILVDMVANTYLALVLYSLMCLLDDYLGGRSIATTSGITTISMATPPCCCCCPCLPRLKYNKRTYRLLMGLVYQVTFVRPLLMFLSAVLWLDGVYIAGQFTADNPYVYLAVLNLCSSMCAVWILIVIQRSFKPVLARFRVVLKFFYIQLSLLGTILGNIIITVLVEKEIIPCSEFMPSKARASRLYHSFVILWMFFVSCWGRYAYRRLADGARLPDVEIDSPNHNVSTMLRQLRDDIARSTLSVPNDEGNKDSFMSIPLDDDSTAM